MKSNCNNSITTQYNMEEMHSKIQYINIMAKTLTCPKFYWQFLCQIPWYFRVLPKKTVTLQHTE